MSDSKALLPLLRPKAIVLDMDGTLLRSDQSISPRTEQALRRYAESGGIIIIATGRPPRLVLPILPELAVADYFIYYNGAMITDANGEWEQSQRIPNMTAQRMQQYLLDQHENGVCIWEDGDQWYANRMLNDVDKACFLGPADSLIPTLLTEESIGMLQPSKMLIPHHYDIEDLSETFKAELHVYRLASAACVEITPKEVSKARGIELVVERLGFTCDEIIVFGDDYNDIAMFQYCSQGVAMANAIPELIALAANTTASNDEDGVALVLEQLVSS